MEEESSNSSSSFISSTNWIVSHGSLENPISFETPISSINDEDLKNPKDQFVVLKPPSLDSGPCEIKLSFVQRHEIRQVYVRSTARVYEIYYATGQESSNEYLCTVRCGIAAKEDATPSASDIDETIIAQEGSTNQMELPEDKIRSDSNNSTDEDGWVDVKLPASALLDSKTSSVAKKIDGNTERSIQDFYEATAEITDASPCISLTLRLLSLNTKDRIYLDEIYIFGEPVEFTDTDATVDPVKSSAKNSLMAMLVPTLLQISKTGMSRAQDKHVSDVRQGMKHQDDESSGPCVGKKMQQEAQSGMPNRQESNKEEATKGSLELTQLQSDEQDPGTGQGPEYVSKVNDSSSGRIERVLDQLVSRVGRIESFCSRFEENMLKPFSNLETRLERMEQQLQVLAMRSQTSEFYPCTKISAPSCDESETNSLRNDENGDQRPRVFEFAGKNTCIGPPKCDDESSSPINDKNGDHWCVGSESAPNSDAPDSVAVPPLFPGLIITAPEFSNDDSDDDDNDDSGHGGGGGGGEKSRSDDFASVEMDCPKNKPSLSLDDALALALDGFLSSASTQPPIINQTSIVRAPESSDEDHGDDYKLTSPAKTPCRRDGDSSSCLDACNETEYSEDSEYYEDPTHSDSSQDSAAELPSDGLIGALIRAALLQEEGTQGNFEDDRSSQTITGNSHNGAWEDDYHCSKEDTTIRFSVLEVDSNPDLILSDTTVQKAPVAVPTIESGSGSNSSEIEDMIGQKYNSTVDFELPVLDVKFAPQEHFNTGCSLESLLSDVPKTNVEDYSAEDADDNVPVTGKSQLLLEDESSKLRKQDHLLVEVDDIAVKTVVPDMGNEQIPDPFKCNNEEVSNFV